MNPTPSVLTLWLTFWFAILGSVTGSFLACLVSRRQAKESIGRGRSHCTVCGNILTFRDLIPIVSYLTHKGRCRFCKSLIPIECLLAELAGAIIFVGTFLYFGLSWNSIMWLIAGTLLLFISLEDGAKRIILDQSLILLVINRLLFLFFFQRPIQNKLPSLLGGVLVIPGAMLILTLIMDKIMKKETMGGGDIKLMAVMGLYLNWKQMFLMIFASCIFGLGWIAGKRIWKKGSKKEDSAIPFGPFLSMGCFVVSWFGEPIIQWYINLF